MICCRICGALVKVHVARRGYRIWPGYRSYWARYKSYRLGTSRPPSCNRRIAQTQCPTIASFTRAR